MSKSLYVGGPADGEWIETADLHHRVEMVKRTPIPISAYAAGKVVPVHKDVARENYYRCSIAGVMRHERLTDDEVLKKLVDGYKPND